MAILEISLSLWQKCHENAAIEKQHLVLQVLHTVQGAYYSHGWWAGLGQRRGVRHGSYARSGGTTTSNAQNRTKTHIFSSCILSESKVEDPCQAFRYSGHTKKKKHTRNPFSHNSDTAAWPRLAQPRANLVASFPTFGFTLKPQKKQKKH